MTALVFVDYDMATWHAFHVWHVSDTVELQYTVTYSGLYFRC